MATPYRNSGSVRSDTRACRLAPLWRHYQSRQGWSWAQVDRSLHTFQQYEGLLCRGIVDQTFRSFSNSLVFYQLYQRSHRVFLATFWICSATQQASLPNTTYTFQKSDPDSFCQGRYLDTYAFLLRFSCCPLFREWIQRLTVGSSILGYHSNQALSCTISSSSFFWAPFRFIFAIWLILCHLHR